jgi:AraC-like DNA-binding protein
MSLRFSADLIDAHLRTVQEAGIGFFSDAKVSGLLKPDEQYTLEDRAGLLDILQSLKRTGAILTEFADDLFMFIDHDKVYTTSGIEDFEPFFGRVMSYGSFDADYWRRTIRSERVIDILEPSTLRTIRGTGTVVPVIVASMVRGNNAVLAANISVESLRSTLKGNAAFPSTRFVALDGRGRVVFGMEDEAGKDSPIPGKLAESFPDDNAGSLELALGGKNYFVSYVQSDVYGWKLYALTPMAEFADRASGILNMIVLICVVLVVIGLSFSFIFAFKLYTPIQRIKDALADPGEPRDDPEPASDDYGEIGHGIRRLIRSSRTFELQLNSVWSEYMDQTLLHLIKDREIPNEAELHKLFRERLGFAKDGYRVCNIHFQFKEAFYEHIPDEDRIVVWSKLRKLIGAFLGVHFRLYVLECTRHLYVCVIEPGEGDDDQASLRKALDEFMRTFQFDLQYCIIRVGIGQVREGVRGIGESYKEAMLALQHADGTSDCEIVQYERLAIRPSVLYTFADEIKLMNGLKAGEASVKEKVSEFVRQHEERGASPHALAVLLTDLYRTGLRFVMEQGLDRDRLVSEEADGLLGDSDEWPVRYEDKKEMLLGFYDRLAAELGARQQTYKANSLISAITDMIETEYGRELYLESISDRLGLSPKYVSRIFKEKTGMNITEYMNRVRIDQAKLLLAGTDMTIGDIAERVGINSRTTFLRIFKKTEGIAPQSYRKAEWDKNGTPATSGRNAGADD